MDRGRRITWTLEPRKERREILSYWTKRNKSNSYSVKLRKHIEEKVLFISANPDCGIPTEVECVNYVVLRECLIFFQETKEEILILSIWDGRQNPEKLQTRLE